MRFGATNVLSSIRYHDDVTIAIKVVAAADEAVRHGHLTFQLLPSRRRHEEVNGQGPAEVGTTSFSD